LFEISHRLVTARRKAGTATALAAAVAGAPFVALAGYLLDRARGIRPSELLDPYALKLNLSLLAGCLALYLLVCFALPRWRRAVTAGKPRPWLAVAVGVLLLGLNSALLFAFDRGGREKPRVDVLILLVDALRADHLGCYGYGRETTPAIDALADDGVVFRQAITQSTFTKSSIASLFTARYPYQHGVYWGSHKETPQSITSDILPGTETTLAEVMQEHGYFTAAWVQNSHLRHFMGFAQGFVRYRDQQGSIARIHHSFRRWLRVPAQRYPYFAYLHYIDLHDPYRPKPPYDTLFGSYSDVYAGVDFRHWGAYLKAVREKEQSLSQADVDQLIAYYDGQLRYIDEQIGRLLGDLRESGLYEDSLIILTADHGDAFMEHGFISHSSTPYEELAQVPLIVKFPQRGFPHGGVPEGRFRGQVVERQVRLVDLMPTILEAVGITPPPDIVGCSLLPLVRSQSRDPGCGYAVIEIAEEDAYPTLAIRTERWKYIHQEKAADELYDLVADPGERHNLISTKEEEAGPLRQLALELVAQRPTGEAARIELNEQLIQELRALGYVDD
ncbi:MAG: sulfatase-like hydrolase/transferase, partial [bacterium]|nr:sulfatase-like hydrolase/transferase [bacterium]